jgi:hypothetical protein
MRGTPSTEGEKGITMSTMTMNRETRIAALRELGPLKPVSQEWTTWEEFEQVSAAQPHTVLLGLLGWREEPGMDYEDFHYGETARGQGRPFDRDRSKSWKLGWLEEDAGLELKAAKEPMNQSIDHEKELIFTLLLHAMLRPTPEREEPMDPGAPMAPWQEERLRALDKVRASFIDKVANLPPGLIGVLDPDQKKIIDHVVRYMQHVGHPPDVAQLGGAVRQDADPGGQLAWLVSYRKEWPMLSRGLESIAEVDELLQSLASRARDEAPGKAGGGE